MFIGKVSGLDYQHLEGKDTGNLISKVDEEFGWRTRRTIEDLNGIFANLISLTTVTIILLPRYPVIWVVLFVSQIPQYFIQRYWVQKDWQIHEENSEKNKQMWDLNYKLREKNYISELRINNATSFLYQKFCDIFDYFVKTRTGLRISQTPSEVALIIFSALINGFCLFTLIKGLELNLLTIGLFTFYFETIRQTGDFFRGLVFNSVSITENSYHIGNFRQVINLKNKIISGRQRVTAVSPAKIEFVDVSFHYPNSARYVYRHLNLVISPAEEIAIVGPNGAGKSTLIKLLCRFYDPTAGAILINGINLKNINLDSWYRSLSFLPQEFNTYGDLSLKENVTIARPKSVNHNNVIKALNLADARFYKKYPQGLDTKLSQRYGGEEPSWGQWQKIAIARVFYRNAPVIILDEPTASIDAVSEAKIFNRLYSKTKGKTLIIVSHRFSTVRNAQRILVIDKGKIVEQGSHQDLLAQKGVYAHSYRLQAKGYQEE
jgi:ABC-type multidrug transport system fused ATPase/permease subunit